MGFIKRITRLKAWQKILFLIIVLIIFGSILFIGFNPSSTSLKGNSIVFEEIDKDYYAGIKQEINYVIYDEDEWLNIWNLTTKDQIPQPIAPKIDFSKNIVIAAFLGGRSNRGYGIEIMNITEYNGRIVVAIRKLSPKQGEIVLGTASSPYQIVKVDRINKPFIFEEEKYEWQT